MIYKSQSRYARLPGGYLRFRSSDQTNIHGYGEGDYIRLRDEFGGHWVGSATRDVDSHVVRYQFRNDSGRTISGVSDMHGIILRDEKGHTWRGFVD
jgi:hypothetical protein